jgi:hypothetical protein
VAAAAPALSFAYTATDVLSPLPPSSSSSFGAAPPLLLLLLLLPSAKNAPGNLKIG